MIFRIWEERGWTEVLRHHLRDRLYDFDVIANLKVMVANRLLEPKAKLHILDWIEGVYFPGIERGEIDYNHLLRAMDFLLEHKKEVEPGLASPILTLFDNCLDLVFYDLTSCYFEIDGQDKDHDDSSKRGVNEINYVIRLFLCFFRGNSNNSTKRIINSLFKKTSPEPTV